MFSPNIFAKLAALTGQEIDLEDVRAEQSRIYRATNQDRIATLIQTAKSQHITIAPVRMKYFEALWQATEDFPVVIWNETEQDWTLITKSGLLTCTIADGDSPYDRLRVFHGSLWRKLGIASKSEMVEVGIVQESLPCGEDNLSAAVKQSHKDDHDHTRPEARYLRMLLHDRRDILTLLVFSIFSGVLYLTVPLAVDTIVSNLAFGTQAKPYIQALIIVGQIVMGCLVLQAIITAFQYYVSDVIQRRIFARTTADIAYRLPRAKMSHFDKTHAPELVNRFLDVVTAQKNTAFFLLDGINSVMATVIGMILLSLYHPFLLVFVAVLIIIILLIIWVLGKGAIKTSIAESHTKYSMVSWFEEIASYPTLFKGPGGQELASKRANKLATDYVNARSAHFRVVIRQVTAFLVLSVIAAVILLLGGAWLVISQQITLGQLVASEIIMSGIIGSLAKLGKKLEAWYDTMAAMDKLGHIFDLELEPQTGEVLNNNFEDGGFCVKAENVSFSYPDQSSLIKDLSFDYPAGSNIAVLGSLGSGVSALLDMFFDLRTPTSGYITINGTDLRDWKLSSLREHVLLLRPQLILGASVIDNLRLGHDDIGRDEIRHALQAVGLLNSILNHPDGLDRQLSIGGSKLPKNERVSLLIARAIVQRPKLLIIDELFDGVEDQIFESLSKVVFSPDRPWTVLYSTRRRDHTIYCDHIIELNKNL